MPYRHLPPDDLAKLTSQIERELADAKRTILAVRLAIVFFAFIIAIQAISNCCLVQMHTKPAPAEKPP